MGFYRAFLSLAVILFHSGSIVNQNSGPIAVFGFYLLSGFMMTATIGRNYSGSKWWKFRFLANRCFRVFPLYWFFVILTLMIAGIRGSTVFNYIDESGNAAVWGLSFLISCIRDILPNELAMGCFPHVDVKYPVFFILNGFPKIIPQAWSLTSEVVFYLCAPLLFRIYELKGRGRAVFYLLSGLFVLIPFATFLYGLDFPAYSYRSTFSVFFIFLAGMLLFYNRGRLSGLSQSKVIYWVSLGILLFLITTQCRCFLNESFCYLSLTVHMLIVITAFNLKIENILLIEANIDRIRDRLKKNIPYSI